MGEDNPTRILRSNNPIKDSAEETNRTRVIGGPTTRTAPPADGEERTRVVSGYSSGSGVTDQPENNDAFELAVGWLVVTSGPGRGCTREIYFGMNSIGRGPDERIPLDFGDSAISRESHAFIVFDEKQNDFYIQHGGKSNLVRLNNAPVLAPQELKKGDLIEIGSTKLMFVPLCGEGFEWSDGEAD